MGCGASGAYLKLLTDGRPWWPLFFTVPEAVCEMASLKGRNLKAKSLEHNFCAISFRGTAQ